MVNLLTYWAVKSVFTLLAALPYSWARTLVTLIVRVVMFFLPRYRKIALINLNQAFPGKGDRWYNDTIKESYRGLARLIVDFARMPLLSEEWIKEHVEFPPQDILDKLSRNKARAGVLFATGHLGSFEILAYAAAVMGFKMSFIVRNFKNKRIDTWWNRRRAAYGNKVIDRKGAVKNVMEAIYAGDDVGILFDQNVTRKHAVFVDLFGKPAATTKTPGLVAVRTQCPVMVVSITHKGNDYYKINCVECDFSNLYQDQSKDNDEKILEITQTVSKVYESMIAADPGAWFWMHRRWKTRPEGEAENFYLAAS